MAPASNACGCARAASRAPSADAAQRHDRPDRPTRDTRGPNARRARGGKRLVLVRALHATRASPSARMRAAAAFVAATACCGFPNIARHGRARAVRGPARGVPDQGPGGRAADGVRENRVPGAKPRGNSRRGLRRFSSRRRARVGVVRRSVRMKRPIAFVSRAHLSRVRPDAAPRSWRRTPVRVRAFALASIAPLARRRRTRRAAGDARRQKKKSLAADRFSVRKRHGGAHRSSGTPRARAPMGRAANTTQAFEPNARAHDRRGARGAARGKSVAAGDGGDPWSTDEVATQVMRFFAFSVREIGVRWRFSIVFLSYVDRFFLPRATSRRADATPRPASIAPRTFSFGALIRRLCVSDVHVSVSSAVRAGLSRAKKKAAPPVSRLSPTRTRARGTTERAARAPASRLA